MAITMQRDSMTYCKTPSVAIDKFFFVNHGPKPDFVGFGKGKKKNNYFSMAHRPYYLPRTFVEAFSSNNTRGSILVGSHQA
jgi:hypothetical protein